MATNTAEKLEAEIEEPSSTPQPPPAEEIHENSSHGQSMNPLVFLVGGVLAIKGYIDDPKRFSEKRLEKEAQKYARGVVGKKNERNTVRQVGNTYISTYEEAKQEYYNNYAKTYRNTAKIFKKNPRESLNGSLQKALAIDDTRLEREKDQKNIDKTGKNVDQQKTNVISLEAERRKRQDDQGRNRRQIPDRLLRRIFDEQRGTSASEERAAARRIIQKPMTRLSRPVTRLSRPAAQFTRSATQAASRLASRLAQQLGKQLARMAAQAAVKLLANPYVLAAIAIAVAIIVIFLIIFAIVTQQGTNGSNAQTVPAPTAYTFVALGDSLTAWPDLPSTSNPISHCDSGGNCSIEGVGEPWPWHLATDDPSLQLVKNAGVPTETTTQILARFNRDVAAYNPDVVFVLGGTNDTGGIDTIGNIKQIIAAAQAKNIKVILLTIPRQCPPLNYQFTSLNTAIMGLPSSYPNLAVIDIASILTCGNYYQSDGLHFTDAGAQAIANYIDGQIKARNLLPTKSQGQTVTCPSGDYTACLKDNFNIVVTSATSADLAKIFQAFAFAGQSSQYVSLLKTGGQTINIDILNSTSCSGMTYGYSGIIDVYSGCFSMQFSSYRYILIHESGHIIDARNPRLYQSFPWTQFQTQPPDSSCYDSGFLKSYALRSGVVAKDESFAETVADSLTRVSVNKTGSYNSQTISDFPVQCPATYTWAKTNIFGGFAFF
jgi:lysophospholipase L1-like esterase